VFGYVRPLKGELKVRHYELYRAVYCGLCRTIKKQYGFVSTLFLNYDMAFLAALLLGTAEENGLCDCRCMANPLRKKRMCAPSAPLEHCAAAAVILTCGKLDDEILDGGFWKAAAARSAKLLLHRAERKAKAKLPRFHRITRDCMDELSRLEQADCAVLDKTADTFARILEAACNSEDVTLRRLLYHVGRWIYIADAADDLKKDAEKGQYNPIAARFGIENGVMDGDTRRYVQETMAASANLACDQAVELQLGQYGPLVGNILALGLPFVAQKVLEGCWHTKRKA